MNPKLRIYLSGVAFALFCTATSAQAEIVVLTSGRTLSVKGHRVDGESVILKMRNGGEVTCDKSLIEKIVEDEVPHPEPQEPVPAVAPEAATDSAPDAVPAGPYAEIIAAMAETHGVDPMLVSALIQVESGNKPRARSNKGAMGLMQLMPSTARQYKLRNPYDPKANIAAGVNAPEVAARPLPHSGSGSRGLQRWRRRREEVQWHPAVPRDAELRQPHPLPRRHPVALRPSRLPFFPV